MEVSEVNKEEQAAVEPLRDVKFSLQTIKAVTHSLVDPPKASCDSLEFLNQPRAIIQCWNIWQSGKLVG